MVETLKNASQVDAALVDLVELVRASRAPLGFLAGVMNRGYATFVIQRAMGVLVAGSPEDAEHEIETAAAREHFNREVVVDASAVVTLTGLSDPNRLTGRYLSVVTPPAAMLGLHRTERQGVQATVRPVRVRTELHRPSAGTRRSRRRHPGLGDRELDRHRRR